MLIVDSQVHIWAASTAERPWPPAHPNLPAAHRPEPITAESLIRAMGEAGVDRAVIMSPVFEGFYNDVVLAAARAHPDRFLVMGRFDPAAAGARDLMPTWKHNGLGGVRLTFHRPHQRPFLSEGRLDWFWPQAERYGIPVMAYAFHSDLPLIGQIARRHPDLRLAIDHLGLTKGKDEEAFEGLDRLLELAVHPNVAVKLSCLPLYTADAYPYRRLHPYLHRVYERFGPQRTFWGSDLSRLPCSYRRCVTMFTEEMAWLSGEDLGWIMGLGICRWLGWPV